MKNLWFAVLFISLGASGQTAITAQITDSDSQTWNAGTWTASLVSPSGPPQGCTTATTVSGTMSGSGVLTGSLCDNSLVGPSGSTWRFTICPHASANCSQVSTAVSGSTENLSSVLSAGVTAPRFAAAFGAFGYADVEVATIPPPGATYYNVTTPAFRQWNGSAWVTVGGGGSSGAMTLITDQVLGAPAATVVFTAIPATFKYLRLYYNGRCTDAGASDALYMQANGDSGGSHYVTNLIIGSDATLTGTASGDPKASLATIACAGSLANSTGSGTIDFVDYANSTFLKQAVDTSTAVTGASVTAGATNNIITSWLWANTGPITSLTLGVFGGTNFVTGSRFTLYGIN